MFHNGEISIVHRIHPVIKLFGLFIYVLVCFMKFNNILFIFNISFVFLLMLLSNIDMMRYLKVVWKMKYILLILYAYMYHIHMEIMEINVVVFKLIFFLLYWWVIVFTTTREDIGKGCSIVVNRFNIIGVSVKEVSMFITNIFVFIDYFKESFKELVATEELRGVMYSHSSFLDRGKFIVTHFKNAINNSKVKMNNRKSVLSYRMYNSKVKRKYSYSNKLFLFDYIYVILNIGMILFYILKVR